MKLKYALIFLGQLFILWLLNEIGMKLAAWLDIPIPGNVIGMILLFILLLTGVIKLEWINEASSFLLKHLVFFFLPITVGIMTLGPIFLNYGIPLAFVLFGSAAFGIILTGAVSQLLASRRKVAKERGIRDHNI
ncbi:CidA/LrgA family protein [Ornithinibacillus sp. 4-3]|uniref:CidA/LrgA family protein n=1 Tax=Ornithinibacillus sp. 4-3 TaxID=3231488 RepID=A0AB39HN70_9BACI